MPGVAEAELERDARASLRAFQLMWSTSTGPARKLVPRDGGILTDAPHDAPLPGWVTEADVDFYAGEFARGGFRGPLNWYRNIDRNWELTAPWAGARITQPAFYMIGEDDPVKLFKGMDRLIPNLETVLPGLREKHVLPGCGHWIQREKAGEVNEVMLRFLGGLDDAPGH